MMKKIVIFFVLLFLVPMFVSSECKNKTEDRNKTDTIKFKLIAIASILVAGALGVSLPVLGKMVPALSPEHNFFMIIKTFAAGVILATGFVHVLPDAHESLTSPCLSQNPWGNFPFTGFIVMVSAIGTMMVDLYATNHYESKQINEAQPEAKGGEERSGESGDCIIQVHTHTTHGHAHGSVSLSNANANLSELIRSRVVSQVLELGIVVHSVIIGVSLGASQSPKTIKSLVAALTFHQLFEGMGLGGCISKAKFRNGVIATMIIFFSLTTPIGIAIGFGISSIYNEYSPTSLIVEGVFNSISAGILIYMALVDFLAEDFRNPRMKGKLKLQLGATLSLLLGAGCMSLLALWA